MKKQTITAVIPAENEEKNIERCISSLDWCDKVQVLWMGNDDTGSIAKKLGAEVVEIKKSSASNFVDVQKNINWAIDRCKTNWMLRIDADEEVTAELRNEIQNLLQSEPSVHSKNVVAYGLLRNQYFFGGFLKGGDWAYDRLIRLFKPQHARYEPLVPVHEQLKVKGKTDYLRHALNHYSHPTLEVAVKKFNHYTSLEADNLNLSYEQALGKMLFLPPYIFLRWFFWHKGFKDGLRGVVAGLFRAGYDFLLYAKYLEKKQSKN